jgi:hypothetical protein
MACNWRRSNSLEPKPGSAWAVTIANLPGQTALQNYGPDKLNGVVSHQHPDHD